MTDRRALAEQVRAACLEAALAAYEQAGIAGLCGEGRWELAIQAIRTLDLARLLEEDLLSSSGPTEPRYDVSQSSDGDPDGHHHASRVHRRRDRGPSD